MNEKNLFIVRKLLHMFNEQNINYCHWKSNQHFTEALSGIDDLDILIDRSQYAQVGSILNELHYKHFYTPKARTYVGIEDFIGFDYPTGKLVHLHLHSQLVVGEKHLKGFHLPIELEILERKRFDEEFEVYFSSYFDELILLILRMGMKVRKRDILKPNQITGSTKMEFDWLKTKCPDFERKVDDVKWLSKRISDSLKKIYHEDTSWVELYKLQQYLYSDLSPYSQGSRLHNTFLRNFREFERIILEINKRFLHTKNTFTRRRPATGGLIIAFLGSDGAGKSSAISEIYKWLAPFMDVRFFYLGSGNGNSSLLRIPIKAGFKVARKMGIVKSYNNFSNSSLKEVDNKKMNFFRRIWVYLLSCERIRKLISANRCKIRGFVVLTDRYPQSDYPGLCDGRRLGYEKGIAAKKEMECFHIASLCPPDLVIKLIVSPEVAVSRKPEEIDVDTSRNLTERVKIIHFSEHTKCIEINSDRDQSQVWLDIKKAIWDSIG